MSTSSRVIKELRPNPFRKITMDTLDAHPALCRHPKNPNGTKYIRAYRAASGRLLAHDLPGAKAQAIWVSSDGFPIHMVRDIPVEIYPAGRARNSNLRTYIPLSDGECYRFKPSTVGDIGRIVDAMEAGA